MSVCLCSVACPNNDILLTSSDGDPEHRFHIGLDAGNLMVARPLDWEKTRMYNLTLQVTDGVNYDNCTVSSQFKGRYKSNPVNNHRSLANS